MAACQCHKVWWILQFYDCIWSYHVWFRMYQCNIRTCILYMFLQRRCLHSPPRLSRIASGKLGSFMFFLDPSMMFFALRSEVWYWSICPCCKGGFASGVQSSSQIYWQLEQTWLMIVLTASGFCKRAFEKVRGHACHGGCVLLIQSSPWNRYQFLKLFVRL
jgi:hypothetical protein